MKHRMSRLMRYDTFAHAHRWVPFRRVICDAFDASIAGRIIDRHSRAPAWLIRRLAGV